MKFANMLLMYTFRFFELVAHVEHVADTHDDEGGHAVETYIFSNGFVPPRLAKNGRKKGMGLHCGRSRRRRPAEIGKGTDNIEVAVFTGDFIDDMGTPIGTRASERRNHLKFVSENLAELLDPDPIYGYYLAKNSFVALVLEFT